MENLEIITITSSSPEYAEVFELRDEILRKPLGMSLKNDDLSRDHTDIILVGKHNGRVIVCLMLHHLDETQIQLRQMAVHTQWQGKGAGKQLVQAAEQLAAGKGYKTMVLHARKTALGFYSGMNYSTSGSEFEEVGIPHYIMLKDL
jgi:N-acetylglutamate synthase-like GNAT family acetyltransferase